MSIDELNAKLKKLETKLERVRKELDKIESEVSVISPAHYEEFMKVLEAYHNLRKSFKFDTK